MNEIVTLRCLLTVTLVSTEDLQTFGKLARTKPGHGVTCLGY